MTVPIVPFARYRATELQDRLRRGKVMRDLSSESLGYRGSESERDERDALRNMDPQVDESEDES